MNYLKKFTMGMLVMILGVGMVGCSSKPTTNNAEPVVGNGVQATAEVVEIEFWYGLGGALGENMENMVTAFNESQDKIRVKTAVQGDYSETMQKLQAAFAAGNVPEVVILSSEQADTVAKKGMVVSLQPYIDADADFEIEDLVGTFREQGTYEGELLTMPAYGTTQVLYYNKEVLESNGFTESDLSTWQGLAEVAKAVSDVDANGKVTYAGWEPMWGAHNMMDAVFSAGGQVLSEDGTSVLINDDTWVEVWEQFRKWIHEDKIMKINSGGQGWEYWYKTIDDVMQDRALGYTGSAGDQGDLDFEKLAATVQPGWGEHPAAAMAGAQMLLIPEGKQSEEKKEAAYELIKFLTNAENTAQWAMNTGYIAVRNSAMEVDFFKTYLEENPQAKVPLLQADQYSAVDFFDPTGGKIYDALSIAVDKVQIENVDAKSALDEAAKTAQQALDKVTK